jgi:hypothetical protein
VTSHDVNAGGVREAVELELESDAKQCERTVCAWQMSYVPSVSVKS